MNLLRGLVRRDKKKVYLGLSVSPSFCSLFVSLIALFICILILQILSLALLNLRLVNFTIIKSIFHAICTNKVNGMTSGFLEPAKVEDKLQYREHGNIEVRYAEID